MSGNLSGQGLQAGFQPGGFSGDCFDQLFPSDDFHFLDEADHVRQMPAPGAVEDAAVFHRIEHVDDAAAELFGGGDGLRRVGEIELVDRPECPRLPARGLHFVEPEECFVFVGELAKSPKESRQSDAMPARALQRFDDNPRDFIRERLQNLLDDGEAFIGELLVLRFGSGIIDEGKRNLEIPGDEAMKIPGDNGVVRKLRDVQRENRPAMERLVEMDKPPGPGSFPASLSF